MSMLESAVMRARAAQFKVTVPQQPPRPALVPAIPKPPLSPVIVTTDTRKAWQVFQDPTTPTIASIKRLVCIRFNVKPVDLISQRRTRDICWPRQIAMYLCITLTACSLPMVGRQFGNKDHTTVLHARDKIKALRLVDADVDAVLKGLEAELQT